MQYVTKLAMEPAAAGRENSPDDPGTWIPAVSIISDPFSVHLVPHYHIREDVRSKEPPALYCKSVI